MWICHIQIDHTSPTSTCVDVKTVYVGSLTGKAIHNKTQILADIAFNGVQEGGLDSVHIGGYPVISVIFKFFSQVINALSECSNLSPYVFQVSP